MEPVFGEQACESWRMCVLCFGASERGRVYVMCDSLFSSAASFAFLDVLQSRVRSCSQGPHVPRAERPLRPRSFLELHSAVIPSLSESLLGCTSELSLNLFPDPLGLRPQHHSVLSQRGVSFKEGVRLWSLEGLPLSPPSPSPVWPRGCSVPAPCPLASLPGTWVYGFPPVLCTHAVSYPLQSATPAWPTRSCTQADLTISRSEL